MSRDAAVEGAVTVAVAGLWYAMPDVVRSRPWRGVLKAGLVAGAAACSVRASRRAEDRAGRTGTHGAGPAGEGGAGGASAQARIRALTSTTPVLDATAAGIDPDAPGRFSPAQGVRAVLAGLGIAGTVAGTVAIERAIFRWGERRRERGVRGAHTAIGVGAGVVTTALVLLTSRLERAADDA